VVTRPVRPSQVLLGKWPGLAALLATPDSISEEIEGEAITTRSARRRS